MRRKLAMILEREHFEVATAPNGLIGLDLARAQPPDLVICDIMMPKKDGWQVLEEVKSNAKTRQIPVIVLTAKDGDPDLFKAHSLGADYYMTKPFTFPKAQLLHAIQSLFGNISNREHQFAR